MAPERGEGLGEETAVAPATQELAGLPHPHDHSIKEGDGALEGIGRGEDDDLTSLTWLQDKNLLKGINLRREGGAAKQESPPSDYIEDSVSERSESTCSSVASSPVPPHPAILHPPNKHPHHIPYDPKVHTTAKPPYSFSCLIFMSIENSVGKALPVKEIYAWILDHFPYYRTAPNGWKNSVRHNLSLNKCFKKVDKAPNLGKGSLWMVDPIYRPNLVQALMKAPYHPYTNLDRAPPKDSHRVSGGEAERETENGYTSLDEIDDVDAARVMLALKHGPASLDLLHSTDYRWDSNSHHSNRHKIGEENGGAVRHSEDHTYSVDTAGTDSADEAFDSDSNSSWCMRWEMDPEERRKTAEGADALLDLAGVTRTGCRRTETRRVEARRGEPPSKVRRLTLNNNIEKSGGLPPAPRSRHRPRPRPRPRPS